MRAGRLLAVALLLTVAVPQARASAQQPADPRYFDETAFRIDNDAFWTFFQRRGSINTFGYPVSRVFTVDGLPVQIF